MTNNIRINNDFTQFQKVFLEENQKHNLISKNDEKYLYEKHIFDSLSIKLFFDKYKVTPKQILDIGCGGGFPCVPIALEFPELKIIGIDSINKKINSVKSIKNTLSIDNLDLICDRVENLKGQSFDLIVSRAVANLDKISKYACPLLKKGGYFIAYKSKKSNDEILEAESTIKSLNCKIVDQIDYTLPLSETYERKLICIKKIN